ncbi:MAG: hypothetical protein LBM77_12260 [Spirochaetaceae bacterium]|jgi:predicted AAA+ superfamily ATPase|nr:hypothetical protein [Spirochaetaceae bacterium]
MYRKRTLESDIRRISGNDKALLLNGPRQVGKTTLLKAMAEPNQVEIHHQLLNQLIPASSMASSTA